MCWFDSDIYNLILCYINLFGLVWFGYLFNGIATSFRLFNAEIWFICKRGQYNYIFNVPLHYISNYPFLFEFDNNLSAQLYAIKYSYLILFGAVASVVDC